MLDIMFPHEFIIFNIHDAGDLSIVFIMVSIGYLGALMFSKYLSWQINIIYIYQLFNKISLIMT